MNEPNVDALRAEYSAIEAQLSLLPKTTKRGKNAQLDAILAQREQQAKELFGEHYTGTQEGELK